MAITDYTGSPLLDAAMEQKYVIHNQAITRLDLAVDGQLTHDMVSSGDYTATGEELYSRLLEITDTGVLLTVPRNIVLGINIREFVAVNSTAMTLTFKTAAGTGIAVYPSQSAILRCDGTNVLRVTNNSAAGYHTGSVLYDFSVDGGAVGSINLTGDLLPDNATISHAWNEVITAFTSGGSATVALGVDTDDAAGLKAAAAYNDASYAAGYNDLLPDGTAANFTTKTTAQRDLILTIATAALTAGKVRIWFDYLVSE